MDSAATVAARVPRMTITRSDAIRALLLKGLEAAEMNHP